MKLLPCPICNTIPKIKEDGEWFYVAKCKCKHNPLPHFFGYSDLTEEWNRKVRAYVPMKNKCKD